MHLCKRKTQPPRLATAIASALSPPVTGRPSSSGLGSSPAKLIDGRSKCYKQLSELNNLKVSRIISEDEYLAERRAIMEILSTLKA